MATLTSAPLSKHNACKAVLPPLATGTHVQACDSTWPLPSLVTCKCTWSPSPPMAQSMCHACQSCAEMENPFLMKVLKWHLSMSPEACGVCCGVRWHVSGLILLGLVFAHPTWPHEVNMASQANGTCHHGAHHQMHPITSPP